MARLVTIGRTIIRPSSGTGGGYRLPPKPSEVADTPPGLNQCGSRFDSSPGEGPPWPFPSLSHARYPTGRSPDAGGGHRLPSKPCKAAGTLPSLDQCGSRFGSHPGEGRFGLSPFLLSLSPWPLSSLSLSLASLPGPSHAVPLLSLSLAPLLLSLLGPSSSLSPWPFSLFLMCRAKLVSQIFRAWHDIATVSCHAKPGLVRTEPC